MSVATTTRHYHISNCKLQIISQSADLSDSRRLPKLLLEVAAPCGICMYDERLYRRLLAPQGLSQALTPG